MQKRLSSIIDGCVHLDYGCIAFTWKPGFPPLVKPSQASKELDE
jgi:hypothetical protein